MGKRPAAIPYTPRNPEKYVGSYPIVARSSWEVMMFQFCDLNTHVLEWASEPVQIPYKDPLTGKQKIYIPDLLIHFLDAKGRPDTLLIEIKPAHEAVQESVRNYNDSLILARNQAKWAAAAWWCQRRGINFKVMTEAQLFGTEEPKNAAKKKARSVLKKATKQAKKVTRAETCRVNDS